MFTTKIIPQEVSIKTAITATLFWILSAGVFGILLLFISPKEGAQFLSVFTMEKLLSFDNLFVFSQIFTYFSVPNEYRYKVLHWGILGAIVLRFLYITLGVGVITFFKPALILMGVWVLYTVYQMYQLDEESEIEEVLPDGFGPVSLVAEAAAAASSDVARSKKFVIVYSRNRKFARLRSTSSNCPWSRADVFDSNEVDVALPEQYNARCKVCRPTRLGTVDDESDCRKSDESADDQ
jgi:hypothetical protein